MVRRSCYDVVILGTGPAGLQAAVHAVRRRVSVLVLGRPSKSSLFQAHIENYFSLFSITGEELLQRGREQVSNLGVELSEEIVTAIDLSDGLFSFRTDAGSNFTGRAVVLATGTKRNTLGVPGEKSFVGKGVSYCVDCDGLFYKGQDVCVVGDESAAAEGVLTLTKIAETVHLMCESLDMADALREEIAGSGAVIHEGRKVAAIEGGDSVEAVRLDDGSRIPVAGVFIELGAKGVLELTAHLGIRLDDEMKFIQVNKQQETNIPGLFAAGDLTGMPWQLAKAVGEGCIAGIRAAAFAKKADAVCP
ncbi:MAG: NAD(P)/FAD-dependent oxidoreductase [Desulfobacterales bacterium]